MDPKTIIFLMGPTACGKSSLGLALAKNFPIEIINVDSAQVYLGMDIGTAKPSGAELALVKHHLLDLCLPHHPYSVAQFCQDAATAITEIQNRGNIPVLVGGTMLYFYALRFGLAARLPAADQQIRAMISAQADQYGWPHLHSQLANLDPEFAKNIAVNDVQRIQRGLEVCLITGNKFSDQLIPNQNKLVLDLNSCKIKYFALVHRERESLHKKIAARFYQMIDQGFVAEVERLLAQQVPIASPAMRCVGYRQIAAYLMAKLNAATAYTQAIVATRQLAKKQYTWLRKWQNLEDLNFLFAEHEPAHNLMLITRAIKC